MERYSETSKKEQGVTSEPGSTREGDPMRCSSCGKEVDVNAVFCPHCGYRLGSPPPQSEKESKKIGLIDGLGLGFGTAIGTSIGCLIMIVLFFFLLMKGCQGCAESLSR